MLRKNWEIERGRKDLWEGKRGGRTVASARTRRKNMGNFLGGLEWSCGKRRHFGAGHCRKDGDEGVSRRKALGVLPGWKESARLGTAADLKVKDEQRGRSLGCLNKLKTAPPEKGGLGTKRDFPSRFKSGGGSTLPQQSQQRGKKMLFGKDHKESLMELPETSKKKTKPNPGECEIAITEPGVKKKTE